MRKQSRTYPFSPLGLSPMRSILKIFPKGNNSVFCTGRVSSARVLYLFCRRCFNISSKELCINEEIKAKEVRVVTSSGEQLGILSVKDALKAAEERDLDLVEIAPNAVPPVCKIMDYGKYKFEQAKREKDARKNQKVVDIKEIRIIGLSIDTHDLEIKANNAKRFIKNGDKVKVTIRFRGRELGHSEIGKELMQKFADYCSETAVVEKPAQMEGRNMIMFLSPKSKK